MAAVFVEWRAAVLGGSPPGVYAAYSQGFLLLPAVFVLAFVAGCLMQERGHDLDISRC